MRISDWSSDVCSSDLRRRLGLSRARIRCHCEGIGAIPVPGVRQGGQASFLESRYHGIPAPKPCERVGQPKQRLRMERGQFSCQFREHRSEEHTSELQSLMRISYAVFCLKKTNIHTYVHTTT